MNKSQTMVSTKALMTSSQAHMTSSRAMATRAHMTKSQAITSTKAHMAILSNPTSLRREAIATTAKVKLTG